MVRVIVRVWLAAAMAAALSGCVVFGPLPIPLVRPAQPGPAPTPVLPTITLEYAGSQALPVELTYTWRSANASQSGGAAGSASPPLSVPAGDEVEIVITGAAWPAALWVAELDGNGVPHNAAALTPTSDRTAYAPVAAGRYRLQVLAEWTYQNTLTALFEIDVQP